MWAKLRGDSVAFLKPFEPEWAADELTQGAWRARMRRQRATIASGRALVGFLFLRDEPSKLVGGLTLTNIRRSAAQSATVGYWMGAAYAFQGYMSEALEAVAAEAFGPHGLHRLEAAAVPENQASRRVLERCGFQFEGVARSYLKIAGQWRDHHLFARLASDKPLPDRAGQ